MSDPRPVLGGSTSYPVFSRFPVWRFLKTEKPLRTRLDDTSISCSIVPKELSDLAAHRFFLSIISTTDVNYRQCYRQTSSKSGQLSLIWKNRHFQTTRFSPGNIWLWCEGLGRCTGEIVMRGVLSWPQSRERFSRTVISISLAPNFLVAPPLIPPVT